MILVPTPQLLDLIQNHIDNLSTSEFDIKSSIWLTTPKSALPDPQLENFSPNIIFIDEPESLLSPLPPRHLQGGALRSHPFYKHPPPLATLLDQLARLAAKMKTETRMVWVGAGLNGLLKRTVRQRGWAGMDALDLDFESATGRALKDIESITGPRIQNGSKQEAEGEVTVDQTRGQVKHVAYVVGSGVLTPFTGNEVTRDIPSYRTGRPAIENSMIEAIVQHEQHSPTPDGTITLILPPEGYPLDMLATRLTAVASALKVPMLITTSIPSAQEESEESSILLMSRSAVPGLDIPNLSRVILINGLDLAGLSPAQRSRGGIKKRAAFYNVVTGRLGRLGSVTYQNIWSGEVISFITEGSGEEVGLGSVKMTPGGGFVSHIELSSHQGEDE
jgi:hypothetical protein